jgi:hypothetical protein
MVLLIPHDKLRLCPDADPSAREVVLVVVENNALVIANPYMRTINLNVYRE